MTLATHWTAGHTTLYHLPPQGPLLSTSGVACFLKEDSLYLRWINLNVDTAVVDVDSTSIQCCVSTLGLSVSVYYVAVRTIVLSRHGSNLARHVHDIIHSLMCMPSTPHCGFSGVSLDGNCAYVHWGSFTSNSKSVKRAIWFTWFSEPHDTTLRCPNVSVQGTWQSQAVTHPIMNRALRCLNPVIEPTPMRQRRIPHWEWLLLYISVHLTMLTVRLIK